MRPHVLILKWPQDGERETFFDCLQIDICGDQVLRRYLHIWEIKKKKNLTISTNFSKKGTSFSSSLSFLSMNQLSIGIPLDSWWNIEKSTIILWIGNYEQNRLWKLLVEKWEPFVTSHNCPYTHAIINISGQMPTWPYCRAVLIQYFHLTQYRYFSLDYQPIRISIRYQHTTDDANFRFIFL